MSWKGRKGDKFSIILTYSWKINKSLLKNHFVLQSLLTLYNLSKLLLKIDKKLRLFRTQHCPNKYKMCDKHFCGHLTSRHLRYLPNNNFFFKIFSKKKEWTTFLTFQKINAVTNINMLPT